MNYPTILDEIENDIIEIITTEKETYDFLKCQAQMLYNTEKEEMLSCLNETEEELKDCISTIPDKASKKFARYLYKWLLDIEEQIKWKVLSCELPIRIVGIYERWIEAMIHCINFEDFADTVMKEIHEDFLETEMKKRESKCEDHLPSQHA